MRKISKKESRKHRLCLYNGVVVSYRVCDHSYHCKTCEFYQYVMDYDMEEYDTGSREKLCIYSGIEVAYRVCDKAFNCTSCAFNQMIQDTSEAVPFYREVEESPLQIQHPAS